MKAAISIISILFFNCACCTVEENSNAINNNYYEASNCKLDSSLCILLEEYIKENRIDNLNKYDTRQAYFISFFLSSRDSLLLLGLQPFVLSVFPTDIVQIVPNEFPKPIGHINIGSDSNDLIIYDIDNVGINFYDDINITSQIPDQFFINPDHSYNTHIPSFKLYSIRYNKFLFLREFDSVTLE